MSTLVRRRGGGREPQRLFEITDHLVATLRRGGADLSQLGVPAPAAGTDTGVWEDVSDAQASARALAWTNSMRRGLHDDYLRWHFCDLDDYQQPQALSGWLDSLVAAKQTKARPATRHFIVSGNIGSGKTTAIAALGNEAAERGLLVRFVQHSAYLAWRRPNGAPDGLSQHQVHKFYVEEPDLLILDELCGEMDSVQNDFVRSQTTDLVGSRIASGKATAFSTNLRRDGIKAVLGERLVSRIENRAYLAKVIGPDRRAPVQPLDW
ncbi:hypothetical protein ACWD4V_00760 [Streptomyces tsukubensis]